MIWRARAASWSGALALILICLAVYLPGLTSIPPVDRDECRFAQASRQMAESSMLPSDALDLRVDTHGTPIGRHAGGWAVPMVATTPRLNKPPLIYWLQATSARLFSGTLSAPNQDWIDDAIWMYRLPSVLCAIGTVLVTWRLGRTMFDARVAWLAAAMIAVAPMIVWDAHQARADQLLTFCTTAAMACLWPVLRWHRRPACADVKGNRVSHRRDARATSGTLAYATRSTLAPAAAFWLFLALGVLAKGFITPMIAGLAVAAWVFWTRRAVRLHWLLGVVIVLVVVSPWLVMIAQRIGLGTYLSLVWNETFVRAATGSKEGHWAPPGFHLLLLAATFWPGSLLVLPAFERAFLVSWGKGGVPRDTVAGFGAQVARVWRLVRTRGATPRAEVFLLAWVVPAWAVFEISLAKLPHYTMPLLPGVALLTARMIFEAWSVERLVTWRAWWWVLLGLALPVGVVLFELAEGVTGLAGASVNALMLLIPVGVLMVLAVQQLRASQWAHAHLAAGAAGVIVLGVSCWLFLPGLVPGLLTARLWREVERFDATRKRLPIASVYAEDSVVFMSRGWVEKIGAAQQQEWLASHPNGVLIGTSEVIDEKREARRVGKWFVYGPMGVRRE